MNDPLEPPQKQYSSIAVFDFDNTLARNDSLFPFIKKAVGKPKAYLAVVCSVFQIIIHPFKKDKKTFFKKILLKKTLKGKTIDSLKNATDYMKKWPEWLDTIEELKRHYKAGHKILIATGSLDIYIKEMLNDIPYHDILCTKMEIKNGVLTGNIENENCVREYKAKVLKEYMNEHNSFSESWGYGNEPDDLPMMTLLDRSIVIEK